MRNHRSSLVPGIYGTVDQANLMSRQQNKSLAREHSTYDSIMKQKAAVGQNTAQVLPQMKRSILAEQGTPNIKTSAYGGHHSGWGATKTSEPRWAKDNMKLASRHKSKRF